MSDANAYATPHGASKIITAEQRARISHNFRAAKALLARKRPRDSSCKSSDASETESPARIAGNKRIPLMEIPTNTTKPFSVKALKSTSNACLTDLFITPVKRSACSGLLDSFSSPSLLDDGDFDESILEEIDAICQQNSAVKGDAQSPYGANEQDNAICEQNSKVKTDAQSPNGAHEQDNAICEQNSAVKADGQSPYGANEQDNGASFAEDIKTENEDTLKCGDMPEEYLKYLKSLNDRQREAACGDISIPLMIVAGPGSGKTSTMVGRVLKLLSEGISPSNILAMTFTTAAASEMRDRIGAVAGKVVAKELTISTFHAFSLQLCRSHAEKLERTSEFLIYGHGHQRRAIIEAVRLLEKEKSIVQNHDEWKFPEDSSRVMPPEYFKDKSKKWQKFVTRAKASGKTPADCHQMGDEIGAAILENYNNILRSCNALDYHDLISCSVKLITEFPEAIKECQDSWKAVVIDEFQDTSAMQYSLLRLLASHNRVTIVGDGDQSIFSFNGADISGFESFRRDFPNYKEIRLNKNYRSTRYIVEAASSLIRNNMKRCQFKDVLTDNSSGSKITIKECQNEYAQCAFIVDKILETALDGSPSMPCYGSIAILYRRQVSGKMFQSSFRDRKIPFNVHGVAFYRKKVVKAIIAMLRTSLPTCDDGPYRQVFKALLPFEKDEKKKIIDHIDKISTVRKCSFVSAARDIFSAKISGTFKRNQLTQGRKVLSTLDMISNLVQREQSISTVITSVANMVPQKYLIEQRAVVDIDGGKLLNEDNDLRSVLQYLLDDVSDVLSMQFSVEEGGTNVKDERGCVNLLKGFIDYITERERENFRSRRHDNENSVTLTTIHQSKGLEWDVVFIVKANESEIPLLHECNGFTRENETSIEEERRLFYVAMTRARKKLFVLYLTMDSNWQMLQPSRFLKEIPDHLREIQAEVCLHALQKKHHDASKQTSDSTIDLPREKQPSDLDMESNDLPNIQMNDDSKNPTESVDACNGNVFLRRFPVEDRSVVSHLFHQWAKKKAFQNPKRLLDKVGFIIDERMRVKKNKHKDVLRALKSCLSCEDAFQYAEYVLRWEQIPADRRAYLMREKQEHFQKLKMENSMSTSAPTSKQIGYLQNLGCTVAPTSRLHASRLIEQYKSL